MVCYCQGRGQVTELFGDPTAKAFGLPPIFRHWEEGACTLRVCACANENYMKRLPKRHQHRVN